MKKEMSNTLGVFCLVLVVAAGCKTSSVLTTPEKDPSALTIMPPITKTAMSERMALSVLKRNPWMADVSKGAGWGYTQGLVYLSLQQLGKKSGDKKYGNYIEQYANYMIDDSGNIKGYKREDFNLDNINTGKVLFDLYRTTKNPKYRLAIEKLRDQLRSQPRTSEGGYWHKLKYTSQMWLDGAYMASPFLAQYAATFNDAAAFDEVALQLSLMAKHLEDPKTGLLYHGWDESKKQTWADKNTGRSPNFWGRAIGWYAMALVDALDYFPQSNRKRAELVTILQRLIPAIVRYQESQSGLWYQVVDQGSRKGNYLEASASCMFVYAISKAVHKGYVDHKFLKAAEKGYQGITTRLIAAKDDGEIDLLQVCEVAGLSADRDGSYEYYVNEAIRINDPKGTGPFILASIELNK